MPILRDTADFLLESSNVSIPFAAGVVIGAPYSIYSAVETTYEHIMYEEDPDYDAALGGLSGFLMVLAIDYFRPSTKLAGVRVGTIAEGRYLLHSTLAKGALRSSPVLAPIVTVGAIGIYNATAEAPSEYQHPHTPWYLAVAQGLTGGFGIGTAGSQFL